VGDLTLERFVAAGGVETIATLYNLESGALVLLERCGADRFRLPRFETADVFWDRVTWLIAHGAFRFDLDDLVAGAQVEYPGNKELRELADDAGTHPTATAGRRDAPAPSTGRAPGAQESRSQPGRPTEAAEHGTTALPPLAVLLLMAAPTNANLMRLDAEHRAILRILERRRTRTVDLTPHPATQVDDLIDQIAAAKPDMLHFTGHGSADGRLVFENAVGKAEFVSVRSLAKILRRVVDTLECVLLGSCYSAAHVEELLLVANAVIGTEKPINDAAATSFTRGFYTGLVNSTSTLGSFHLGLGQMELNGHPTGEMRYLDRDGNTGS
jgi:hypothetical protein